MPRSNTVTPIRPDAKPRRAHKPKAISEKALTVRPAQGCEILNVGPTKMADLIRTGKVESIKIGKTRLITMRSIRALAHGEMV